ncbi:hypothetical protein SLS58_001621 [Diplodia intermedia]|uniref:Uncharacterized protein n=1 Tax=Diplodia intermedia TaxID=856260 RepID=A0ABR3U2D5_9PEZI
MTSHLQDGERYDNHNTRLLPDNMAGTSDMPGLDGPDLELNMPDLELLHHFTVTTAYTLGATAELQTWWRIEVPHLAISYPFVMRALLSLSGIHVARTLLSPSSSSSPDDNNDNNISLEQRRLQAADHTARAQSQLALALRTAHALLPCTLTTTHSPASTSTPSPSMFPSSSSSTSSPTCLNPYVFPPLYICATLATLISFAAIPSDDDAEHDAGDLLIVTTSNGGAVAPWLRLSRSIKQAADRVVVSAAAAAAEQDGSNSTNTNTNTALLMSHAVGMPLRLAKPPAPPPPPQARPPPNTSSLRYDPCHDWTSTSTSTPKDRRQASGKTRSRSRSRSYSYSDTDTDDSDADADGLTDPAAVAAGIAELAALRRWFVALYEQRYTYRRRDEDENENEDREDDNEAAAAADEANLASLVAAIDALMEGYAAFDRGGGGGGSSGSGGGGGEEE